MTLSECLVEVEVDAVCLFTYAEVYSGIHPCLYLKSISDSGIRHPVTPLHIPIRPDYTESNPDNEAVPAFLSSFIGPKTILFVCHKLVTVFKKHIIPDNIAVV